MHIPDVRGKLMLGLVGAVVIATLVGTLLGTGWPPTVGMAAKFTPAYMIRSAW